MSLVDTVAVAVHLAFAATWVGSIVFFTLVVLPFAREGTLAATGVDRILDRTTLLSRVCAVVLFLTGGHLAGARLQFETFGSMRWNFVLAMIALWFVLMALVEVGAARMSSELKQKKVRSPAREQRPVFLGASAVGVLLFLVAAVLSTGSYATLF